MIGKPEILAAIDAATGCQQCAVVACAKPTRSRGWCGAHYERWRKHGDPLGSTRSDPWTEGGARLAARSVRAGRCLLYVGGHLNRFGYGRMSFMGRQQLVHRVAWTLTHGPIPDGLFVCHRCDVPNCIEVDHLFLGTAAENNADRDRKGRATVLRGSRSGSAKLREWQVLEIKQKLTQGRTLHSLADEYGVAWQTIGSISHGRNWRHVEPARRIDSRGTR